MRFKDKCVFITGANAGIGEQATLKFAKEGAILALSDLSEQLNDNLQKELKQLNTRFSYKKCDVAQSESVYRVFAEFVNEFGKIDIGVNNAGILGPRIKTDAYPESSFDQVIDVNVKGVFYCMKGELNHFMQNGGGVIVNTASVAGYVGMGKHIAYGASKHAVLGMTKSASVEYGTKNIRINAVCPGFTETAMLESVDDDMAFKEMLKISTPMKRFGKPEEIADAILYLASDESSFMTGQGIILDGGLSVQ